MARIRVARGSRTNLPGALDENTLLYGEMYWEREQAGASDGVLYMGKSDGVEDGVNDKSPLAIAGSRAMRSLFFQGLWDPSTGQYPADAQVGDIYVAEADGTGPASTFKYGDWAVCIGHEGETSNWLKAINQSITTEDPLGLDRNPLQLNEGVLKLKYDPATLKLNANGELTVSHTEVYTTESSVHIEAGQPVALNSDGKAIVADCTDVETAIVIGLAATTADPGDFVTVQRADLVNVPYEAPAVGFEAIGAPVYLYLNGTYTQDVEQISPGFVLQQVGIATAADTVDVHIGTPFQIDASSDIYYIPLTQTITAGDTVHAPSSAAVHQIVQQLTNIESEVVTKTDTGTQNIAGSLNLAGDLTANDVHVSANSLYIGDAKLSAESGQLVVTNTSAPGEPQVLDVIDIARLANIDTSIIPATNNQYDLGSDVKRFANVYAEEVHVGASSLYVNGKKVIEDVSNVMEFKTSQDQTLALKTQASVVGSGSSNLEVTAGNKVDVLAYGGVDITVPADANGKNIILSTQSSGGAIQLHGPVTTVNDLTVGGNLTVQGDVTQVNTTQVNLADNIIQINSNQTGVPNSTLLGGIEVNRGDETNYRFVFEELTDTFRIGEQGSLQAVATRKDDMGINGNIPTWNTATNQFQNTTVTIAGSTITGTLAGNAATASKLASLITLTLNGDASGAVDIDGSSNVTLTVDVKNNTHTHTSDQVSDATSASTANMVVRRDASGNFAAGTITAALTGNASSATTADKVRNVNFHADAVDPTGTTRLNMDGYLYATRVYNAVWNDIADFIEVPANTTIEYGKVFTMDAEGNYGVSREYCPAGIMGIASDTYGFGVGQKQDMKQIPIAIGGFVLAHIDKQYAPGTPLTATADGRLTEIKIEEKRDYPERIVATYWKPETDAHWNGVLVNGRHWVKVK